MPNRARRRPTIPIPFLLALLAAVLVGCDDGAQLAQRHPSVPARPLEPARLVLVQPQRGLDDVVGQDRRMLDG